MNLKFESIKISSEDPFANDQLNRKGEVENLTALICNVNSPAVLAIDSPWGTGKTTFIKMWQQHIENEGVHSMYFNAWTTDFAEDPLVSFLGEMNICLGEMLDSSANTQKEWKKTKELGRQIAKRGIPALIRIATAGVVDVNTIVEDELSKAAGELTDDALGKYLEQKSAISAFHESLTELIRISSDGKPIVIFVDELDRCRPPYAISLLERIKHLFDIEGLVFVLSIAKTQLSHSIGAVYGEGIDANSYLRRFIDFEYNLKPPEIENYIDSLLSSLSFTDIFEARKKHPNFRHDFEHLRAVLLLSAQCYNLTLRELEQILANINLALLTTKDDHFIHAPLLVFLVTTKAKYPELYQQFIKKSSTEKEIIEHLHQNSTDSNYLLNHPFALIESYLIASKREHWREEESETLVKYEACLKQEGLPREEKEYANRIINIVTQLTRQCEYISLDSVVSRIEMLDQFQFGNKEEQ